MIARNEVRITGLLEGTAREGMEELIQHLAGATDYFTAPASTKHHHSYPGGLAEHSLEVYDAMIKLDEAFQTKITSDLIVVASLLHDLCKTNYYVRGVKWRKDDFGKWESYKAWLIEDDLPLGHGEKSLYLAARYIDLVPEEAAAIRWHMGAWTSGVTTDYGAAMAYNAAVDQYPLLRLLIMADFAASRSMLQTGGRVDDN